MAITVPQARLILRSFMAEMRNNLAASDLVGWEVHSKEMNDRNGFVVSEQIGPEYNITETNGAVANLTTGVQDTVFGAQTFTLNKVFGLSFGAADLEMVTDLQSARRSRALRNGVSRLASRIDAHIFDVAAKSYPLTVGTWGNSLASPEAVASARTRLAEASLESDAGINGVFTHADRQALAKYIYDDNASMDGAEGRRAMRRGFAGELAGIPLKASNQLGRVTTGTRAATATVDGAAQNVNYADVADSGTNGGYYMTQDLDITVSVSGAETVNAGEVFTIAGIYAYDPELPGVRPYLQPFVVVEGGTAVAGDMTIKIFPAIIVPVSNPGTPAQAVNNAHATVNAAPGSGATITWQGAASTTYTTRMMWKKDSMVVHSAPLVMPYTGQGFRRSLADAERDGAAPLMPRIWFFSDPLTGAHKARIDVFVQAQVRNRLQGVRMFGA